MIAERDKLAQTQALRKDILSFLTYIGAGKGLRLTQISKNLTLKDVRAINNLFVEPEELDQRIGDHVYRLRNEEEAARVHFIRCLCKAGGLVKIRQGWISQTKRATSFSKWPPSQQLSRLFEAWWWKDSWGRFIGWPDLAVLFEERADYIANIFLTMPLDVVISFAPFAKQLSDDIGYIVKENDERDQWHTDLIIERAIIYPLGLFGVLKVDYKIAEPRIKKVKAFTLTPLGNLLFRDLSFTSRMQINSLPLLDDLNPFGKIN